MNGIAYSVGEYVVNTESKEIGEVVGKVIETSEPCVVVRLVQRADGTIPKVGTKYVWALNHVESAE